jgi:CHAT domain-containing protein
VDEFCEWFRTHRGVKEPTLRQYARGATDLLCALGEDIRRQLAEGMLKQARMKGKHVKECQVLITSSRISVIQKDHARAVAELKGAIALAKAGGYKRLLADAQFTLADVFREMGDLAKAEEIATAAADSTQSSGEIYLIPKRLQSLAQLKVKRGKYAAADALYSKAGDFMDAMLAMVPNVATKSALIIAMSELYTGHFSLIADHLHDPAQAYNVLERARGRITTDLLRNGSSSNLNLAQAREIDQQISRLRLQLLAVKAPAQVRQIRDRIFLVEQARWLVPQTTPLRAHSTETIPLRRVIQNLGRDELLLEYVLAEPHSYCLVIDNGNAQIINLPARDVIETRAAQYLTDIKNRTPSISEQGKLLYSMLLAVVPGITNHPRLVIVPDGRLHLLPFDALVGPDGRYLVTTHRITYTSSASAYYLLNKTSPVQATSRSLLAVGGVPYDQSASFRVAVTRGYSQNGLTDLPGSKDEVLAVTAALSSPQNLVLTGTDATESAFKHAQLDRQRVIHMAVHGIANEKHPDRAALILLSDPGAGEDGILQLSEIVRLHLNADLVVLSACDTAVGRLLGEEGISNLSRAFLLAGAKTVVSTLWSIDDDFSLSLMKRFYTHLTTGEGAGAALTEAKRDMLNTFGARAVPYYWAGFVLEGVADRAIGARNSNGKFAYASK